MRFFWGFVILLVPFVAIAGCFVENSPAGTNIRSETTAPDASFTSHAINRDAPLIIQFEDQSSNRPDTWIWTYKHISGNNTDVVFSTAENPTLTIDNGSWLITLNASNSAGYDISSSFSNVSYDYSNRKNLTGIQIFPTDYVWNVPIDKMPVHPNSSDFIASNNGANGTIHPGFGYSATSGWAYDIVDSSATKFNMTFYYSSASYKTKYPIPLPYPSIGGAGADGICDTETLDCPVIIIDRDANFAYEIYGMSGIQNSDGSWNAGSGAVWNLSDYTLRGRGEADASGTPLIAGMIRYDEVASGSINHAIGMAIPYTRYGKGNYTWPALHQNSVFKNNVSTNYPRMGERFRLKAAFNVSGYSPTNQIILAAMKKYGMIVVDNGERKVDRTWQISGIQDSRWNWTDLSALKNIKGADLEAVDESLLMINKDSGQVRSFPVNSASSISHRYPN
jgi:hypothetical protein